jgi:hypothetical protein
MALTSVAAKLMKTASVIGVAGAADPEPITKGALLTVAATTVVAVVVTEVFSRTFRKLFDN